MALTYVIRTNLDPEGVNAIGLAIFAKWLEFALGRDSLGGRRLVYPTGRYAAALSYRQEGEASIAIVVDEHAAPEAAFIEHGHGPVDLKTRLRHGHGYPLHRPPGSTPGTKLRRAGSGPAGLKPTMWAEVRGREFSGFASIGPNSAPGSWIIPPMPAYSPGLILAAMAKRMAEGG